MRCISRDYFRLCQCLAISCVFCQALAIPAAAAVPLNVRRIDRRTNVQNLDRIDWMKWYATESIRYTVTPCYRDGSSVEIPDGASALWVLSQNGTNFLAAAGVIEGSNVVFEVAAGDAALPGDGRGDSYAALLVGPNLWGVIDRTKVQVFWSPSDATESRWAMVEDHEIRIAELEEAGGGESCPCGDLAERVAILWDEIFPPVSYVAFGGARWVAEDAGEAIPTHRWTPYAGRGRASAATVEFPDGRVFELCAAGGPDGTPAHAWTLSDGTTAHPPTIAHGGTIYEMSGVYDDDDPDKPTHTWRPKE